jgi:hypothetical protein
MTLVVKDRVKETTTTTGTGTITLAGAAAGFQAFSVLGDGNTTYYAIVDSAAADWEVGIGTYTLSGTTLARTTVLSSSNAGAAVNLSAGSKDVFVTQPAEKAITYFTDAENTTGVNASKPVNALIVANAGTNVDVALSPKGSGAVLAQIPDGTATGGNKRGTNAVDWQTSRSSSSYVASATGSVVAGGVNNRAAGAYSTIVGGANIQAVSSYTIGGGYNSSASSSGGLALGYIARADGYYSTALGYYADSKERPSSFSIGGYNRSDSGHPFQTNIQNVSVETTDATPTVLTGYSSASWIYQNRMDVNSAYAFKIMLIAGVTGAGDTKAWELTGCIKRGASGVPTLVGAVTKTVIASDTGAATWDCDIVIDTEAFMVQATGQAATTIRWTASIYTAEMEY